MTVDPKDFCYSPEEADNRTKAIVRAAAKTPPIPLKAIPKKNGGKRKIRKTSRHTATR